MKPAASSAYTLIEILVGITIIGFLFGFGYVSFRDFSKRQALAGIQKQVVGDLRLAQQEALSGQKPDASACNNGTLNAFNFDIISSTEYRVEASCSGSVTPVTVKDVTLPTDITISVSSGNPVKFNVLGNGTNIAVASVTYTVRQISTGSTQAIDVSSSGEIH